MTEEARSWRARFVASLPLSSVAARKFFVFLGACAFLSAVVNVRYPDSEPPYWYLLPAVDVVFLLAAFVLVGAQGWRVPKLVRGMLAVGLVLVRLLRLGDGFQEKYYAQRFALYTDLPLVPEGARFLHSTLPGWKFWPLALVVLAVLLLVPLGIYQALGVAERYLAELGRVPLVAVLAAVAFLVGLGVRDPAADGHLFAGGFGASFIPRLRREAIFLYNVFDERSLRVRRLTDVEAELARTPSDLAKLGHRNVYLILVESYGDAVVDRPHFVDTVRPTFSAIESELGALGFAMASGRLTSPTFGGHSWLAHATLGTAVRTRDQLGYDLVCAMKPKSIASFFRDAGYRTVLAQPGTTRPSPRGDFYRFDKTYYARDFEYAGPPFAWATMPDQYVLDFVRRRELVAPTRPLFIQYVLVSSHAPWSETPTLVEDWSRLGNGAIYDSQPVRRYPVVWPNFSNATEAYLSSIVYDFEVLRRYLAKFVDDEALVIVLGDHQPVVEVSGDDRLRGVPVHVFSRAKTLVEPFVARGYTPGMWPRGSARARAMETFLPDLLRDFSTPRATTPGATTPRTGSAQKPNAAAP